MQIAICEASLSELNKMEEILSHHTFEYTSYSDVTRLIRDVEEKKILFEFYLLNIEADGYHVIEVAKKLRALSPNSLIVFLTNDEKYMPLVFEIRTFDYLIKPITKQKLDLVLERAAHYLSIDKKYFSFTYKKIRYILDASKILYFEKRGRTAFIYYEDELYKCNMTAAEILKQLDNNNFVQIHSAYIINLNYIKGYTLKYVLMRNSFLTNFTSSNGKKLTKLPISEKYKKSTKNKITNFIKR